jgi:hypothetical protein
MKLRKMYLVSPELYHSIQSPSKQAKITPRKVPPRVAKISTIAKKKTKRTRKKASAYDKWFKYREHMRETDAKQAMKLKAFATFLKNVLPDTESRASFPKQTVDKSDSGVQTDKVTKHVSFPTLASPSREDVPETSPATSYETPKRTDDSDEEENEDDDKYIEEDVQKFGREHFGTLASPFLTPYLYQKKFLDKQYGIRREGNVFMIGDSTVTVDEDSNISIKGREFKGTPGLWELLTRKNVNVKNVTTDDLKKYKSILQMTNAHLEGYEPDANIYITRGSKFRDVISKLFPQTRQRGLEVALRRRWVTY